MARVPQMVTSPTAYPASSSEASLTGRAAAMADAPQIEKPTATSSERPGLRPRRRPRTRIPTKVRATTTTVDAMAPGPRATRSDNDSRTPNSTTPTRSTVRPATTRPGSHLGVVDPRLARVIPTTTATTWGEAAGHRRLITTATVATSAATARPVIGATQGRGLVTVGTIRSACVSGGRG
jgi:hypothetical protein